MTSTSPQAEELLTEVAPASEDTTSAEPAAPEEVQVANETTATTSDTTVTATQGDETTAEFCASADDDTTKETREGGHDEEVPAHVKGIDNAGKDNNEAAGDEEVDDEDVEDEDEDDVQVTIDDAEIIESNNLNLRAKQRQGSQTVKSKAGIDIDAPGDYNGQPIIEVNLNSLEDKPWRKPGADISDYFNYGFNEDTWKLYCEKQKKMRAISNEIPVNLMVDEGMMAAGSQDTGLAQIPIAIVNSNDNSKYKNKPISSMGGYGPQGGYGRRGPGGQFYNNPHKMLPSMGQDQITPPSLRGIPVIVSHSSNLRDEVERDSQQHWEYQQQQSQTQLQPPSQQQWQPRDHLDIEQRDIRDLHPRDRDLRDRDRERDAREKERVVRERERDFDRMRDRLDRDVPSHRSERRDKDRERSHKDDRDSRTSRDRSHDKSTGGGSKRDRSSREKPSRKEGSVTAGSGSGSRKRKRDTGSKDRSSSKKHHSDRSPKRSRNK